MSLPSQLSNNMTKTFIKFIFIILIGIHTSCSSTPSADQLINEKASLPASFQFDKLGLKVIATLVNKNEHTMSTLYGNSLALEAAKTGEHMIGDGEVFALITWNQQADENWYGANIPAELQSVELLHISATNGRGVFKYQSFKGKTLQPNKDTLQQDERIVYILSQKPAVLP